MREMHQWMETQKRRRDPARPPQQAVPETTRDGEHDAVHWRPWTRIAAQLGQKRPGWGQRLLQQIDHCVWRLLLWAMSRPVHGAVRS